MYNARRDVLRKAQPILFMYGLVFILLLVSCGTKDEPEPIQDYSSQSAPSGDDDKIYVLTKEDYDYARSQGKTNIAYCYYEYMYWHDAAGKLDSLLIKFNDTFPDETNMLFSIAGKTYSQHRNKDWSYFQARLNYENYRNGEYKIMVFKFGPDDYMLRAMAPRTFFRVYPGEISGEQEFGQHVVVVDSKEFIIELATLREADSLINLHFMKYKSRFSDHDFMNERVFTYGKSIHHWLQQYLNLSIAEGRAITDQFFDTTAVENPWGQ